jgi:hypothetical protein
MTPTELELLASLKEHREILVDIANANQSPADNPPINLL